MYTGTLWGEEAGQTAGSCNFYSRLLFNLPLLMSGPSERKFESEGAFGLLFLPFLTPAPRLRCVL